MLDQIEATILSTLQVIFDQFGWVGVFGLMVLENATGVTPNELILTFAGWMLIERHGIAPGFILTEMTAHMPLFNREMAKQLTALLQPGLPDDVAELATFLAGSESRSITGQVLRCDGGMFLGA